MSALRVRAPHSCAAQLRRPRAYRLHTSLNLPRTHAIAPHQCHSYTHTLTTLPPCYLSMVQVCAPCPHSILHTPYPSAAAHLYAPHSHASSARAACLQGARLVRAPRMRHTTCLYTPQPALSIHAPQRVPLVTCPRAGAHLVHVPRICPYCYH
ncbi:hypothetical protein BD413DRAFT_250481 [Trametes elegans]|nr:hypothetical protein BD413DRAFT_250481 [Trametes elegans]